MDKEMKIKVLKRAREIMSTPGGFTRGVWVKSRANTGKVVSKLGVGSGPEGAYKVGKLGEADGPNVQQVCCCVEGACYVAGGEEEAGFNEVRELIGLELDPIAREDEHSGGYETALWVNDQQGKKAALAILDEAITRIENDGEVTNNEDLGEAA